MASKLIPKDPEKVMVMRHVTPDILTCSVPFLRFGMIKIGGRGTIVRLQNGTLAVFSPTALTDSVRKNVQEMGEVKYLTALDNEHHIFLDEWHAAYPTAKLIAPDGLRPKREKMNKSLPFHYLFPSSSAKASFSIDADFDREFEYEYVDGHANKELVFCHKPSKTLIEADLMFNLPATEQMSKSGEDPNSGILTKLFGALQNTRGDAKWQKRMLWYALSSGDRDGFNKSVQRISAWDFDRIIPCHGDVIESGGKGVFAKVFAWHIEGVKKST